MLASSIARLSTVNFVGLVNKSSTIRAPCLLLRKQNLATRSGKTILKRRGVKDVAKDAVMKPAGTGAFTVGRGLLAGASVVGIGSLCYYGLGMSNEVGAIDRSVLWPDIVKERIRDTYLYFGGSLAFTAASAAAIFRSPAVMRIVAQGGWKVLIGSLAAMWGSGYLCMSLPYSEGFGAKQMAWILHSSVIGAVVAPFALLGGQLVIRAACYTAGVVGGLSTLAVCAPSEKFLNMGGPLAMGLGVVFMSSIGTWFLPPTTALGAGMYSVAVYGGLVLFGMFLLYDTQKVIKRAETHPIYTQQPFDPINNSVGIYMDTINIFIRIAMILAGGGNRRK